MWKSWDEVNEAIRTDPRTYDEPSENSSPDTPGESGPPSPSTPLDSVLLDLLRTDASTIRVDGWNVFQDPKPLTFWLSKLDVLGACTLMVSLTSGEAASLARLFGDPGTVVTDVVVSFRTTRSSERATTSPST